MMDEMIVTPFVIALGAIPGALSRYYLPLACKQWFGTAFPYGTLIVNLSGSLLMGFCAELLQSVSHLIHVSLLVTVGFLGSYTTFSTYALDTSNLFRMGNYKKALQYGIGSPVLGFLCIEIGRFIAQQF